MPTVGYRQSVRTPANTAQPKNQKLENVTAEALAQNPTNYELVIKLKIAKALSLNVLQLLFAGDAAVCCTA